MELYARSEESSAEAWHPQGSGRFHHPLSMRRDSGCWGCRRSPLLSEMAGLVMEFGRMRVDLTTTPWDKLTWLTFLCTLLEVPPHPSPSSCPPRRAVGQGGEDWCRDALLVEAPGGLLALSRFSVSVLFLLAALYRRVRLTHAAAGGGARVEMEGWGGPVVEDEAAASRLLSHLRCVKHDLARRRAAQATLPKRSAHGLHPAPPDEDLLAFLPNQLFAGEAFLLPQLFASRRGHNY